MYEFKYQPKLNNVTILDYLNSFHLGNEKIKELKKPNRILINGKSEGFNYKLKENDLLTLLLDEVDPVDSYKSHLDILYEDSYILILNKPASLAVHTDGAKYTTNTLQNMVKYYYDKKNYHIPVWYLHRLDFDTTGIIVFCKDPLTMSFLSYELSCHNIKRDYLALVSGIYPNSEEINLPIGRDRHVNGKFRVSDTGKESITNVEVIKKFKRYTLVRLSLKTGRTHQIRVHMAYKGHPLLGDTLYGGGNRYILRQALHSYYLKLVHPITNELIEITCEMPSDMKKLLK